MTWLVRHILRSPFGRALMLALMLLSGIAAWGAAKKREGRRAEDMRQAAQTLKRLRRMQDAGTNLATDRASIAHSMRDGSF